MLRRFVADCVPGNLRSVCWHECHEIRSENRSGNRYRKNSLFPAAQFPLVPVVCDMPLLARKSRGRMQHATPPLGRVVGRCFNRNGAMILRELPADERKFAVACVEACDESVVGHMRFPRESVKDSSLMARGKRQPGNSSW